MRDTVELKYLLSAVVCLFYSFKILAGTPFSGLEKIEDKFSKGINNPNYLVVQEIEWEKFKEDLESHLNLITLSEDSLKTIIRAQSDSLIILRNQEILYSKSNKTSTGFSWLPWFICVLFLGLALVFLFYLHTSKSKVVDVKEEYHNLEQQYLASKRYWIDKERQLKRKLIDSSEKINELEKKLLE